MENNSDFVFIEVSEEFFEKLFRNGFKEIQKLEVSESIDENYKLHGITMHYQTRLLRLFFVKGSPLEGSCARRITPTFTAKQCKTDIPKSEKKVDFSVFNTHE